MRPGMPVRIIAAYFSLVELTEPKLQLQHADAAHMENLMRLAIHYVTVPHPQRDESLRLLYNHLTATQERSIQSHRFPKRVEEMYLDFVRLLSQHYAQHHDIAFYASELCITTTYLSRIVRHVSGHTVVQYIDQMLLIEATWLLQTTTLSVAQIADRLHFAETASFARLFKRLKGCTPKEYRNNSSILTFQ